MRENPENLRCVANTLLATKKTDSFLALCCSIRDPPQSITACYCVSDNQTRSFGAKLTIYREKNGLVEEAHRIIKTIRQMEGSLEDHKSNNDYDLEDKELKVTAPLSRCLQELKEKHNCIAKIHRERFEQVKSKRIAPLQIVGY